MHHVVRVESSYNPYAIGVVGGRLVRQPKSLPEALATVRMLETRGFNFSLGLAQVNRYNLDQYGLDSYEAAFEVCPNLQAGSRILAECYTRSGGDWGKSFSCYYSGNHVTGFRHGYVQKVFASMRAPGRRIEEQATNSAIAVVGNRSRRVVDVTRYPVRAAMHPVPELMEATAASPKTVLVAQPAIAPRESPRPSEAIMPTPAPTQPGIAPRQDPKPDVDSAFVF